MSSSPSSSSSSRAPDSLSNAARRARITSRTVLTLGLVALGVLGVACANGNDPALEAATSKDTNKAKDAGSKKTEPGDDDDDDQPSDDDDDAPGGGSDGGGGTVDGGSGVTDAGKDSGGSTTPDASTGTCTTTPPSNVCGVSPQCGCAANQTCAVSGSSGASSCVTAGSKAVGNACTKVSDCAPGNACEFGACRPYCSTPGSTCTGNGVCFAPQDGNGKTTPNLNVCAVTCDLLSPSAKCGTNACRWFATDGETDCRTAGTVGKFDACYGTSDCKAGLACAYDAYWDDYSCFQWCRVGTNDCGSGLYCDNYLELEEGLAAPVVGGYKLGVCRD